MSKAVIRAIASYLPERVLTNEQLAQEFDDLDPEKVLGKTGINSRHISGENECASDLGVAAAKRLFDTVTIDPAEIDFLIFCTQTPDYYLPTTACLVQDSLGLNTSCGAIDINQGCSGYVYGLALAKSLIEAGTAQNVLLITADTYTKLIAPDDKTLRTLFGDGAAATLVQSTESENELIGPFVFGSDGSGAGDLIVELGGMRKPSNSTSACNLFMDGAAVFNFAMKVVPQTVDSLLEKAGLGIEEIDHFVPHQANRFMLDRLRMRLKIPAEKFYSDMFETGNTVSSSIPIAIEAATKQGIIKPGERLMLIGFGVGLSWGGVIVETA